MVCDLKKRVPTMHMAVVGITGGGKSHFIGSWLHQREKGIHFDLNGLPKLNQCQYYVSDMEQYLQALQRCSHYAVCIDQSNLENMLDMIRITWEIYRNNVCPPIYMCFDEVENYSDQPVINEIFHMGRKHNVFGIAITRNLQEVQRRNRSIISQCTDIVICGGISDVAIVSLESYKIKVPEDDLEYVRESEQITLDDGSIRDQSTHNLIWYNGSQWIRGSI